MTAPPSIIHLGLPKTATTTLQIHLFPNHSRIHYLGKRPGDGFPPAIRALLTGGPNRIWDLPPGDVRARSVPEQLAHAAQQNLVPVFSREGLAGGPPEIREKNARALRSAFGAARLVLFVREPASFVVSYYLQSLKGFQTRPPANRAKWMQVLGLPPRYFDVGEWLAAGWDRPASPRHFISYADTAEIYAAAFGRQNVAIFVFEDLVRDPRALVHRLCRFMEIDSDEGWRLMDGKRANDRLTTGYVERLKALESSLPSRLKFRAAKPKERRAALGENDRTGEKLQPVVPERWLEEIHRVGDVQNRRLVEEWGVPLREHGYRIGS